MMVSDSSCATRATGAVTGEAMTEGQTSRMMASPSCGGITPVTACLGWEFAGAGSVEGVALIVGRWRVMPRCRRLVGGGWWVVSKDHPPPTTHHPPRLLLIQRGGGLPRGTAGQAHPL